MHRSPPLVVHRLTRYGLPALLAPLVFLSFLPVLGNDFVNWDDPYYFAKNYAYRGLSLHHLKWMFTTLYMGHYQPLSWLTHGAVYVVWGMNPTGYHLGNLLLHAANAVVCYLLIATLLRQCTSGGASSVEDAVAATVGALFFALHPLRVEAVAWGPERQEVLCALFFLLAVLAYVRMHEAQRRHGTWRWWYVLSIGCFALSLLSKATGITLPLVLLVLDVYPLRRMAAGADRSFRSLLAEKLPYAALSVAAAALVFFAKQPQAMATLDEHGVAARAAQAAYGLGFYVWKTVAPFELSPLYLLHKPLNPAAPRYLLAGLTVVVVSAGVAYWRRRYPWAAAACVSYVVLLLPLLGFVQSGPQLVADRYSYLSCVGFAMLLPAGFHSWLRRSPSPGAANQVLGLVVVAGLLLTALFHATAAQANIWSSSLHLWARGFEVSPDSSIVNANYADGLAAVGNLRAAEHFYRRSLQLQPLDPITAHHYADLLIRMGDRNQAEGMYRWTLRLDPDRSQAVVRLAQLMVLGGRPGDAIELLRRRVDAAPTDLDAARVLADLLSTHADVAVRDGEEAVSLAVTVSDARGGDDARSLLLWATALAEAGRYDEGIATARRALRIAEYDQNDRLATELRRRLGFFEQNKPFHLGD